MDNILFNRNKKGVLFGENPKSEAIYFDIENEPSVIISDGDENRLKETIKGFAESILLQGNFDIVAFGDCIKSDQNKRVYVYDCKDFYGTVASIAEEIDRRCKLFSKSKVKNIAEYNKSGECLRRIALIIDCDSTALIRQGCKEICLYEALSKGRATGVFVCLFSSKELKDKNLGRFSDILDFVPFAADYYEYEKTYEILKNDEKFKRAIDVAKSKRMINCSLMKRKLKIGYTRAKQYIVAMQNLGIIGREEFYALSIDAEK